MSDLFEPHPNGLMLPPVESVRVIIPDGYNIWLIERDEHRKFNPNMMESPGGQVEGGEGREAAVWRELLEEIGVEVELLTELHRVEWHEDEGQRYITYMAIGRITRGTPTLLSLEHRSMELVPIPEVTKLPNLTEATRKGFEYYYDALTTPGGMRFHQR